MYFSGLAGVPTRNTWLLENLPVNSTVGFDPFLMTPSEYRSLFVTLEGGGIRLVSITRNLVDIVWGNDRPPRGDGPIVPHTLQFTGTEENLICSISKKHTKRVKSKSQ